MDATALREAGTSEGAECLLKLPRVDGRRLQSHATALRDEGVECQGLWQAAREAAREAAAWEVECPAAHGEAAAWEAECLACPSRGLSHGRSAASARSKADHQCQGLPGGIHGRSVGFAPRVGLAW